MGQPFIGGDRHPWVLFVLREIIKHLLAPPTSPQCPAAAFILVKCTGQIKGPQEFPRELAERLSVSRVHFGGANTPSFPHRDPPSPAAAPAVVVRACRAAWRVSGC